MLCVFGCVYLCLSRLLATQPVDIGEELPSLSWWLDPDPELGEDRLAELSAVPSNGPAQGFSLSLLIPPLVVQRWDGIKPPEMVVTRVPAALLPPPLHHRHRRCP